MKLWKEGSLARPSAANTVHPKEARDGWLLTRRFLPQTCSRVLGNACAFDHSVSGSTTSSSSSRNLETAQLALSLVLEFNVWAEEAALRQESVLFSNLKEK